MKKILTLLIFISFNYFSISYANEKKILIKYKINEDLITNYDIIREAKYLKALNKELENIQTQQLYELAKNSLIREKVKKYEIEKYYQINYEAESINVYIESLMKKLGIEEKSDFEKYLSQNETSIKEIKKKLIIEQTWNKMILQIYKDRISIDEKKINQTLDELIKYKKKQKAFKLYELVFFEKNKDALQRKYKRIISDIESLGFKKAAIIHSISATAKSGGEIGWVNQNQLSKNILEKVQNLDAGSFTNPINTAGGTLILQVGEIKEIEIQNIDKQSELSKIISAEKNRQLNEFSVIHYKKTENKSYVKKF